MSEDAITSREGSSFKAIDFGPLAEIDRYAYTLPGSHLTISGKLFLHDLLASSAVELSINKLPPKAAMPFVHKHQQNEEIYVFLSGEGQFRVDDITFPVKEGSVIRVDPAGERTWRNSSDSEDLMYLVIQAPAGKLTAASTEDGVAVQKKVAWPEEEPG